MNAAPEEMTVLVLCADPEDRRRLVESAEPLGFASLHATPLVAEARTILERHAVDLLIVELAFSPAELEKLLEAQLASPNGRIMAVLPPAERRSAWSWEFLPRGVSQCLRSPVDPGEAGWRLARMLAAVDRTDADPTDDDELLFEATDDEYVFSDPKSGQILEVNRAFLAAAAGSRADWVGQELAMIGLRESEADSARRRRELRTSGEVAFRCARRVADGGLQEVSVWQRLGIRKGRLVYLTRLRHLDEQLLLARALDALGGLFASAEADRAARLEALVTDVLGLDFFVVGMRRSDGSLASAIAHGRGAIGGTGGQALIDPATHPACARLLKGESIVAFEHAEALLEGDEFARYHGLGAYLGLPVTGADGAVTGVMIGASREPLRDGATVRSVLEVLAGRQGLAWDVRQLREQSETQGLHDGLTGLPNRILFNDRLELALREGRRSGEMLAVMFVDLDRFKTINDTLGHAVGDELLVAIAERLRASVRSSDTVARYAGDEFTILLRHIVQQDDMLRVAQKINRLLAEPLALRGTDELHITASIGVSFFPDDGAGSEELLRHADQAMYDAKGMGRNTCQRYVEQANEGRQQKLVLEAKLRAAEANDELRVFYQPQVCTGSEDLLGMEALIRWEHPELGLISPGFFIPLAEETGLIVPMGEWLLRRAVAETHAWHERFGLPLVLGVNLSPLQLKQPDLVAVVENALNEAGLEPRFLDLEVTESISIKSIPGLREKLGELRELGCSISIDDFGTGQSSLDYLKRFPADRIKIDQSFVRNIGLDPDDEAIVEATIRMAHSLKLGVIAEGVEEEDHLAFLRRHSCDQCQGFLFCRPLPADSFSRLLVEREALTSGRTVAEV